MINELETPIEQISSKSITKDRQESKSLSHQDDHENKSTYKEQEVN